MTPWFVNVRLMLYFRLRTRTGYQFESRTIIDQPSTMNTPQACSPMPAIPDRMIECIGLGHSRMNRTGTVSQVSCAVLEMESLPFRPDRSPLLRADVIQWTLYGCPCLCPVQEPAAMCPGCQSGRSNAGIGGAVFVPLLTHRDGQRAVNVNKHSRASRI